MSDTGKIVALIKALAPTADPEAIESAVATWLDDHPEATTTVEDGSITKAKLDSDLQEIVDDVPSLKTEINSCKNGKADIIISSASGAIASFSDGADNLPLEDCVIQITPVQDTSGGDPSPTNICPISGWQGLTVWRTGKNLFDPQSTAKEWVSTQNVISEANTAKSIRVPVSEGYVLTISNKNESTSSNVLLLAFLNESGVVVSRNVKENGDKYLTATAPSGAVVCIVSFYRYDLVDEPMLELGSSASPYERYAGQTYPITWQDEAGIVYCGTWNPKTGVLTVTHAITEFDGSNDENWSYYAIETGNLFRYALDSRKQGVLSGSSSIVSYCNSFSKSINESTGRTNGHYSGANKNVDFVYDACTDLTSWRTYLSSNPIQFVYKLATPITYTLSPSDIRTLYGQNHIFADTGDSFAQYRADTKLYVDQHEGVKDVKLNGTSAVDANGVANIPLASSSNFGVAKVSQTSGITMTNGFLSIYNADSNKVKAGATALLPIVPSKQHESVFYGLAKLAGSDMASSSNPVGQFTDDALVKIQKMLGLYREWEFIGEYTVSENTTQYSITTDSNGESFELSEMLVRVWLKASTTGTRDYVIAYNIIKNKSDQLTTSGCPTKRYYSNSGDPCFMQYESYIHGGVSISRAIVSTVPNSTQGIEQIQSASDDVKSLTGFRLAQYSNAQTLIPKDTVIKIYGIRK